MTHSSTKRTRHALYSLDVFEKCYNYTRAADARAEGLYPYFIPIAGSEGTEVRVNGRRLIMAGSNNYLGLTHDARVIEFAERTARRYGTGCTGSRFLNGTLDLHERLEAELAAFVGTEAALVFSTGFQTNLGALSTILGRQDTVVMDRLVHASLVDGARMSQANMLRFRHNDPADLADLLARVEPDRAILLVVDGLYSMEGDLAKLPELLEVVRDYPVRVFVDEAHSIGVFGPSGAGVCELFGVTDRVDLIMGTFSKSFASIGGFLASEAKVIDYVKHNGRSLIYSAAMPPYAVATVLKCLEIIRSEPERRERLHFVWKKMKHELDAMGFDTGPSESPVIPIIVGDSLRTLLFWRALFDEGVFTNPVVTPAVPENSTRLRTSYMATHTDAQLDEALEIFRRVGRKMEII